MKKYRVILEPLEPISVGAGQEDNLLTVLQVPVVEVKRRDVIYDYQRPIIPASSLKGVLRSIGVALAKGLGIDHEEVESPSCPKPPCHNVSGIDEYVEKYKTYLKEVMGVKEIPDVTKIVESLQCPVCLLFGAPSVAGALRLTDLIPKEYEIQRISRVTINRALRTKSEGKLFTVEVVNAEKFEGYAILYVNPCLEELLEYVFGKEKKEEILKRVEELWKLIVDFVSVNGLEVGRGKSSGLGKVEVRFEEQ